MSVLNANMNVIDLTRHVIDLTEEGVQDIIDMIEQNQPQHQHLNGYISDDGFVVGHGVGDNSEEDGDNGFVLPDFFFGDDGEEDNQIGGLVLPGFFEQDEQHEQHEHHEQHQHHENVLHPPQNHPHGQVHAECTVCLEDVTEADEGGNVTILACGHTFHNVCMNGWLVAKPEGECPTCKGTIEGAQNI